MLTGAAVSAVVAVSVLAAPAGASASGTAGQATTSQATTGRITGQVTGHGRPIQDICVRAINARNHVRFMADTSATGNYTVKRVSPGRYYVQFMLCTTATSNWLFQWYKNVTSSNNGIVNPPAGVVTVPVKAGKTTTGINAAMKLGASITGQVTSAATGIGVHHICVFARATGPNAVQLAVFTMKGKDGRYGLHGLFPAKYQLEFACGGTDDNNYAPQWWKDSSTPAGATLVQVSGTENVRNINVKLTPGAVITGTVRAINSSGAPLPDVCVNAGDGVDPGTSENGQTIADGTYRLTGLSTGTYTVTFNPACFGNNTYQGQIKTAQTKAGTTTSGIDAFLQLAS